MDFKNYFNIANKLNEMPQRYSTDHYSELGKFDFKEMNERLKKALEKYKLLKKETVQDIDFYLFDMGHDTSNDMISYSGYAVKDGNVIGYIVADDFQSIPKYPYPKVYVSKVHSDNQGKGVGTALYSMLINYFGGLVGSYNLSGNDKVAGSSHMWQKLMRMFPAYVITMNDYNTEIQNIEPVKNANNYDFNGENSKHQVFMVSKEPIESLKEAPVFDDIPKRMAYREPNDETTNTHEQDQDDLFNTTKSSKIFNKTKVKDFTIVGYKNQRYYDIFCFFENKIVGKLTAFIDKNTDITPESQLAVVYKNYQRQGLALAMYAMVINDAGRLCSSNRLTGEDGTGGSFDIWVKLGKLYPYKYLYNDRTDKIVPVKEFNKDMMTDEHECFVVSKEEIAYNGKRREEESVNHSRNFKHYFSNGISNEL